MQIAAPDTRLKINSGTGDKVHANPALHALSLICKLQPRKQDSNKQVHDKVHANPALRALVLYRHLVITDSSGQFSLFLRKAVIHFFEIQPGRLFMRPTKDSYFLPNQ